VGPSAAAEQVVEALVAGVVAGRAEAGGVFGLGAVDGVEVALVEGRRLLVLVQAGAVVVVGLEGALCVGGGEGALGRARLAQLLVAAELGAAVLEPDLDFGLGEAQLLGHLLAHVHVRVVGLLEEALEAVQLRRLEGGAVARAGPGVLGGRAVPAGHVLGGQVGVGREGADVAVEERLVVGPVGAGVRVGELGEVLGRG